MCIFIKSQSSIHFQQSWTNRMRQIEKECSLKAQLYLSSSVPDIDWIKIQKKREKKGENISVCDCFCYIVQPFYLLANGH